MTGELVTQRLCLRPWRREDLAALAHINADPRVMKHFPGTLSEAESLAAIERFQAHDAQHGFAPMAVTLRDSGTVIGSIGLQYPAFVAAFTPCIEAVWRMDADYWGQGLASEAARAVLADGFERLALDEIVAFTTPANQSSWRLMERVGMQRDPGADFAHPRLPPEHPLSQHWLYRLRR